ncbi:MAG: response regulator transcription factor [Chloroflexota bacterium]
MTEQGIVRVVILEALTFVQQGICAVLAETPRIDVVGAFADVNAGLEGLPQMQPDVVVMAASLAKEDQFSMVKQMLSMQPQLQLLILASEWQKSIAARALAHGACSYLGYDASAEMLVEAIIDTAQGTSYLGQPVTAQQAELSFVSLTRRQREVLQLIVQGYSNREIAEQLGFSIKTAEHHRTQLMKRLGVHKTADLVYYALRHGLITDVTSSY